MPRKLLGPATGGAMTSFGGGATEYYNVSGAHGDPVSERLQREGQLQPGSPTPIPGPGGESNLQSLRNKKDNGSSSVGGITFVPASAPPANGAPPIGGGGGFGGGGGGIRTK